MMRILVAVLLVGVLVTSAIAVPRGLSDSASVTTWATGALPENRTRFRVRNPLTCARDLPSIPKSLEARRLGASAPGDEKARVERVEEGS